MHYIISSKINNLIWNILTSRNTYQWRREGGGRRNVPPTPEIWKIVVEKLLLKNWCYVPEVYTFWAKPEIQEIFSKKLWKKSIFHRDFDQQSQNFLEIFKNSLHFWSKPAKFCMHLASIYLSNRNHSSDLDDLAISINSSRFSPKNVKNFHTVFNSPLSTLFLSFFINFSIRY